MTDPAILARNFIEAVVGGWPEVVDLRQLTDRTVRDRARGTVRYLATCEDREQYEIQVTFLPEREAA